MKFSLVIIYILHIHLSLAGDLTGDDNLLNQKAECEDKKGYEWNESLNSCNILEEVEDVSDNANECDSTDCYIQSAEKATSVSQDDQYQETKLETIGQVSAGAYLLFSKIAQMAIGKSEGELSSNQDFKVEASEKPGAKCASKTMFKLTSAAWVAGDLYLKYSAKKNLEELEEEYKKEISNEHLKGGENGSYQAQVRAFHYLLKEQKLINKQAEMRSLLQKGVIGGYALSAAMGLYETTPSGSIAACYTSSVGEMSQLPPTLDMGEELKESYLKKFTQLGSSGQIALVSGVMSALNLTVMKSANSEKERTSKNIETIEEVIAGYETYKSGLCPNGRDDLRTPECYCYDSSGSQNQNRSNSAICEKLFSYTNKDYAAQNEVDNSSNENMVCVTVNGKIDKDCRCKNMKNLKTGLTACANVNQAMLSSGGFPSASSIASVIGPLNSITKGEGIGASLSSGSATGSSATKIKSLISGIKNNEKLKNFPSDSYFDKYSNQLAMSAGKNATRSSYSLPSSISNPITNLTKGEIQGALNELNSFSQDEEGAEAEFEIEGTGKGKILADKLSSAFGWNESLLAGNDRVIEIMESGKEHKFKDADIVKKKERSLFEVISRRYQITGMRRLFE